MPTRGRAIALVLVIAAAFGAACGSDDDSEAALPPNDFQQLAEIFGPALEPLGLKLTRGALIDRSGGGYEPSDSGDHLAVYAEPTGDYTPADYAEGIVPSAQVFLPEVFERWPELRTFDVCQEPRPGEDDRKEPPPVTQLFVSRAEFRDVDWETVTLAELVAATEPAREGFTLFVASDVKADPAWVELTQAG